MSDPAGQTYFPEEVRAKLRQIKETSRQNPSAQAVDWYRIWEKLESAARIREECVRSALDPSKRTPRPRETLNRLRKVGKKIDDLLQELQDPRLIDSSYQIRLLTRGESPRFRKPVITALATYRDQELKSEIEVLEEFTRGRRIRTQTRYCDSLFLALVIKIGREVFGPKIGYEDSPLIKFVSLAAKSVLEYAPKAAALRTRARRLAGRL